MISVLEETPKSNMALVDVQMLYPNCDLKVAVVESVRSPIQIVDLPKLIELPIGSKNEDQRTAAWNALNELTKALNIQVEDLSQQPKQVVAATYARKLKEKSWCGWLFKAPLTELPLINVKTVKGISSHRKRKYVDYHFEDTNTTINRNDVLISKYSPEISWWYLNKLHPQVISDIPDDFLFWFNKDKKDRGDVKDAWLIAKALNVQNKQLLEAIFYQIKFEFADVLSCDSFYLRRGANLPGNIFSKDAKYLNSLTGMMVLKRIKSGSRPPADKILEVALEGKLPNNAWNDKWIIKGKSHS